MRLIGLALLTLLLAGAAYMLVDRRAELLAAVPAISGTDRIALRIERSGVTDLAEALEDAAELTIFPRGAQDWTALNGLPSYATIRFDLPANAQAVAGELRVNLRSDISSGTSGLFRVSLNGQRRAEFTLREGRDGYSLLIPLTPRELARRQLSVSMAMLGLGAQAECRDVGEFGALMAVEPSTALRLAVPDGETAQVLMMGAPIDVSWPADDRSAQEMALADAIARQSRGDVMQFTARRAEEEQGPTVEQSLGSVDPSPVAQAIHEWPLRALDFGAQVGAVTFERRARWNFTIPRRDLADGTLPLRLDLNLRAQPLAEGAYWSVNVMQNDRIVHQDRFIADGQDYRALIPLLGSDMPEVLAYQVELQADWEGQGPCLIRPELTAELLPSTLLDGGFIDMQSSLEPLMAILRRTPAMSLQLWSAASLADANLALTLAGEIVPVGAVIRAAAGQADVTMNVASAAEAAELAQSNPPGTWVTAYFDADAPAETRVLGQGVIPALLGPTGPRTVLVLTIDRGA